MQSSIKDFIEWIKPFLIFGVLGFCLSYFLDVVGAGGILESFLLLITIPIMYSFAYAGIIPLLIIYSYVIYRSLRNGKYPVALGSIVGMVSFIALFSIKPIDCANSGSSVGACFCEGLFLPLVCLFYSLIVATIVTFFVPATKVGRFLIEYLMLLSKNIEHTYEMMCDKIFKISD